MPIGKNSKRMLTVAVAFAAPVLFGPHTRFGHAEWQENLLVSGFLQAESRETEQPSAYDTSDYDRLLRAYDEQGWVDYAVLARERTALHRFLEQLASVSTKEFKDPSERLAFWINAYNAYPRGCTGTVDGKHQSVRQVRGFSDGSVFAES